MILCLFACSYYTHSAGENPDLQADPTDRIAELARCVTAVVMKDCVLTPESPQEKEYEVGPGEAVCKVDVLVVPGTGVIDFDQLLRELQRPEVDFHGPLLLEKVPGRTLPEIDENMARAKRFVEGVVLRTTPKGGSRL